MRFSNPWTVIFCSAFLYDCISAIRHPVPEIRKLDLSPREPEPNPFEQSSSNELDRRIVCIEDDYLLSLQMFIEDALPSCSAFLGIPGTTATSVITAKTTVLIIQTRLSTVLQATTVPTSTTTVTVTASAVLRQRQLQHRQDASITPAASIFSQVQEKVAAVNDPPVTGLNASLISAVSSACSCLFITESTDVILTTTTSTRTISGADIDVLTQVNTASSGVTTVFVTVSPTPSPVSSPSSSGIILSTGPTTGPILTTGVSTVVPPAPTSTAVVPPGSTTSTLSVSSSFSTGVIPPPSNSTVPVSPSPAVTTIPASSLLSTSVKLPSATSTVPPPSTCTFSPSDCPAANGTIYITQGQSFRIECFNNFGGPTVGGLAENDLQGCLNDCATSNLGFSEIRCYAAAYYPNKAGPNCYFKTQADTALPFHDETTISGLLLNANISNPVTAPAITTITAPYFSCLSTTPSLSPTSFASSSLSLPGTASLPPPFTSGSLVSSGFPSSGSSLIILSTGSAPFTNSSVSSPVTVLLSTVSSIGLVSSTLTSAPFANSTSALSLSGTAPVSSLASTGTGGPSILSSGTGILSLSSILLPSSSTPSLILSTNGLSSLASGTAPLSTGGTGGSSLPISSSSAPFGNITTSSLSGTAPFSTGISVGTPSSISTSSAPFVNTTSSILGTAISSTVAISTGASSGTAISPLSSTRPFANSTAISSGTAPLTTGPSSGLPISSSGTAPFTNSTGSLPSALSLPAASSGTAPPTSLASIGFLSTGTSASGTFSLSTGAAPFSNSSFSPFSTFFSSGTAPFNPTAPPTTISPSFSTAGDNRTMTAPAVRTLPTLSFTGTGISNGTITPIGTGCPAITSVVLVTSTVLTTSTVIFTRL